MKKDVIAAVVSGFILGGLVAVAAINLPSLFKISTNNTAEQTTQETIPIPTSIEAEIKENLEITEPKDESIVTEKELKITGRTKTGDAVLVESESDISEAKVENDGTFTSSITLTEGGNQIIIYSINENGEESKTFTVYYTSDKL